VTRGIHLDLQLAGWFPADGSGEAPVFYTVNGLPLDDYCVIDYAGSIEGRRKWRLHLYRNCTAEPESIPLPDELYGSPQEALRAVKEIEHARGQ
jgi:hypothetical protein